MSCGVAYRCGSDPELLWWLWWRPAAVAPIQLLAWEPPYATGAALKKKKKPTKCKGWDFWGEQGVGGWAAFRRDLISLEECGSLRGALGDFFFFLVFMPFLGPLPWHMEVPGLGVESEL